MKAVSNTIKPHDSVKADFTKKTNNVSIELNSYRNWTHSLRIDDFTNQFCNSSEVGRVYFQLVDRLLPFIKEKGPNIKWAHHCHLLKGDHRELAVKIVYKLHKVPLDAETELWQLSCGQGTRLIASIVFTGNNENVYPLFLDPHHLIYPDDKHNQRDYSKNACKFNPSESY